MLLQKGAKRTLDLADLKDGELDFLASVGLQVEKADGDLLPWNIVVYSSLNDVFGTALNVGHNRGV